MHVHASATAAHVGPKRMLALLLNDDGNVGANFAGDCFGGKMEIRRSRDAEMHGTRNCFQFPMAVRAWIALDGNAPRGRMRLHVTCRTLNLDFTACGIRFDSPAGVGNENDTRNGVHANVAASVRDRYTSRCRRYPDLTANIRGRHGSADV